MKYACLADKQYSYLAYAVVPIRREDMLLIKEWRNEQIDVLRQARPLTDEDQRRYYEEAVLPTFTEAEPRMLLFRYLLDGRLIGYGGLTNLDWVNKRAEISYLLETARSSEQDRERYEADFSAFLTLMKRIAFGELKLNRLFTETFDIRPWHVAVLEKNGFRPEGRMRQHVRIRGAYVDSLIHGCLAEENDDV